MNTLFHGLSAFPITPADQAGHVDTAALGRVLHPLVDAGVQSVGLLGSTGTYAYLTRQERHRAILAASDCIAGRLPLIVGTGALRTDDAQALARDAQAAGANGLLLAPVSYTPLTDDEVFEHFVAVAGETDLPLCIYNNPGTTHFTFNAGLLARLAQIPNIIAVKMPLPADGDMGANLQGLRDALPPDFVIGYSGDWGCAAALLAGADSWFSVVAGLLPQPSVAFALAAMAGDSAKTKGIDARFQPLWTLFKRHGSLRVVYAAANLMGLTDANPPRPILPLGKEVRREIAQALAQLTT